MRRVFVTAMLVIGSCQFGSAADVAAENYQLFPITTESQQRSLGVQSGVFCVVDGDAVFKGGEFNTTALDHTQLKTDLAKFVENNPGTLRIHVDFAHEFSDGCAGLVVQHPVGWLPTRFLTDSHLIGKLFLVSADAASTLKTWGDEAGFESTNLNFSYGRPFQMAAKSDSDVNAESATEDGSKREIGDFQVSVFPIRTRLSRVLMPDADCVVAIQTPHGFDLRHPVLPVEVEQSIQQLLHEVEYSTQRPCRRMF